MSGGTTRVEKLRAALEAGLTPQLLEIRDDSARHAGHAGASQGGHFRVRIVAERFRGLPPLARHRLVYAAAAALFAGEVHALQIDARTPDENPLS